MKHATLGLFLFIGACAASSRPTPDLVAIPPATPQTSVTPAATDLPTTPPAAPACPEGQVADAITRACITACGAPPEPPNAKTDPTCSTVTLKDGKSWHDQLTLQLSSGASTRIDCPRMRLRGQDTPVCVTQTIGGRVRGACCPKGHTNPTDPECVAEGLVDAMYVRKNVWNWCDSGGPKTPCEPCVWVKNPQ